MSFQVIIRNTSQFIYDLNVTAYCLYYLSTVYLFGQLTPQCEQLLVRCRWMGTVKDCSDIFQMRKSMEGYCCSFNYIRPTDNFER